MMVFATHKRAQFSGPLESPLEGGSEDARCLPEFGP